MNWKRRLLCLIGRHKPVHVLESPVKAIMSGGPLSIPVYLHEGEVLIKGKVSCLWCGRPLKGIRVVVKVRKVDG